MTVSTISDVNRGVEPDMDAVRSHARRWGRTAALTATAGVALLALTGCLSIKADVAINSDAKGTGTFSIQLQKQAASLMGMTDLDSFSSGIKQQDAAASSADILAAGKCDPTETSDTFAYTCTFTNADFSKEGELWTIKKDGNQIVFQMKQAAGTGADGAQAADLLGGSSLGDVTVNVTFPGPIQSVTGTGATKTSDTTATITGAMTDNFDVSITSSTSSSQPIGLIIAAIVALLLLAAIIIGVVLFLVRRGKKAPAAPIDGDLEAAAAAATVAVPAAVAATDAPDAPALAATSAAIPMPAAPVVEEAVVAEAVVAEAVVAETIVGEAIVVDDIGPDQWQEPPV
jgi:hypothetical protein